MLRISDIAELEPMTAAHFLNVSKTLGHTIYALISPQRIPIEGCLAEVGSQFRFFA